jgi:hypothetical protein
MEETAVQKIMILLAVLTPLTAGLLALFVRSAAQGAGQTGGAKVRRNLWILAVAGPVNLALWFSFNGLLAGMGSRSVVGYGLAAAVFVFAGFATGFFSRLRSGKNATRE